MNTPDGRAHAPDGSLRAALQTLPDVRRGHGKVHPLDGMLALSVCALVCGGRSLYAISQWGRECAPEMRVALGLRGSGGRVWRRCTAPFVAWIMRPSSGC